MTIKQTGGGDAPALFPAQWTAHIPSFRSARFLVLALLAGSASSLFGEGWTFSTGDGYRDLLLDGKPVLRHMNAWDPERRDETFKPYIHVFAADGKTLLTKGPGGKYTHHRGISIGWSKCEFEGKTYNFWSANERKHTNYIDSEEKATADEAVMVSMTDWLTPEGKTMISEKQTVTSRMVAPGKLQLDFDFVLTAPNGPVKLNGDAQHGGFHYRAPEEVEHHEADTRYIRPSSAQPTQDKTGDVWAECPWVVCDFTVEANRYSVMLMTGLGNPTPFAYSTRAYGRFGSFSVNVVNPETPLKLSYRLLIEDSTAAANEDWAARYAEWTR